MLVKYADRNGPQEVEVENLEEFVGARRDELVSVEIPEGVRSLEHTLFSDCANLREVSVPGSVRTVGSECFYGCRSLETVTMAEGVESLGERCFAGCPSLRSVHVPDSVWNVPDNCFGKNVGEGVVRMPEWYRAGVDAGVDESYGAFEPDVSDAEFDAFVDERARERYADAPVEDEAAALYESDPPAWRAWCDAYRAGVSSVKTVTPVESEMLRQYAVGRVLSFTDVEKYGSTASDLRQAGMDRPLGGVTRRVLREHGVPEGVVECLSKRAEMNARGETPEDVAEFDRLMRENAAEVALCAVDAQRARVGCALGVEADRVAWVLPGDRSVLVGARVRGLGGGDPLVVVDEAFRPDLDATVDDVARGVESASNYCYAGKFATSETPERFDADQGPSPLQGPHGAKWFAPGTPTIPGTELPVFVMRESQLGPDVREASVSENVGGFDVRGYGLPRDLVERGLGSDGAARRLSGDRAVSSLRDAQMPFGVDVDYERMSRALAAERRAKTAGARPICAFDAGDGGRPQPIYTRDGVGAQLTRQSLEFPSDERPESTLRTRTGDLAGKYETLAAVAEFKGRTVAPYEEWLARSGVSPERVDAVVAERVSNLKRSAGASTRRPGDETRRAVAAAAEVSGAAGVRAGEYGLDV